MRTHPGGGLADCAARAGLTVVRRGVRRLSTGLADQAAFSLTTLCISIGALRGDAEGAAEFAILFLVLTMAAGFSRSITTEPVAQTLSLLTGEEVRRHVRVAGVTGLVVGLLAAAGTAAVVRPETSLGWWTVGLTVVVVATDSVRTAWLGARRPDRAVRMSAAQLVAGVAGLVLTLLGHPPVAALVPMVLMSALLIVLSLASGPAIPRRELLPHHWYYAAEWLFTGGLRQSSGLVVAAQGLTVLPLLLRATGVVFGPLTALSQAAASLAVPELAALRTRRPSLLRPALVLSAALVLVSVVYSAVVLLLPDRLLATVLGETWAHYEPVLLAAVVYTVLAPASMGPLVALRSHGFARSSLGAKIVLGVIQLVLPVVGVSVGGAAGFFWGAAAGQAVSGIYSAVVLRRAERIPAGVPVGTAG